jgi:predicted transglutaminase-like cysteine proteinase
LRNQLFLTFLIFLAVLFFGASDSFANEEIRAPRLLSYIGLSVPAPNMDKWLNIAKPGASHTNEWLRMFSGKTKQQQIEEVNIWVNSQIQYREDNGDQWSSPAQTLARGHGDCEDFAIAKYYVLRALGFTEDQVYLIVADDLVARTEHAVLLINLDGQEYILDNFTDNVIPPASAVKVLKLEFAFSGRHSWLFGIKKSN